MRHTFAPIAAVLLVVGVPGAFLSGVAAPADAPAATVAAPAAYANS
jgi:hypothetical protein